MQAHQAVPIRQLALVKLVTLAVLSVALLTTLLTLRSTLAQRIEAEARMRETAASLSQFVTGYVENHLGALRVAARTLQLNGVDGQRLMDNLQAEYPGLLSALLADANGQILAIAIRGSGENAGASRLIGNRIADRSYFSEARARNQPYVSPVFKGRGVGTDWIVALSVPLHSEDGQFAGIVEGSLDLRRIGERVASSATLDQVSYSVRDPVGAEILGRVVGPAADDLEKSVIETTANGWTVELKLPAGYSSALVSSQVRSAALIGVLVLLVSVWMARLLARQISRPIEALNRSIRDFQPGMTVHFGQTVESAPLEVRGLGKNFETLTRRLSDSLTTQQALHSEEMRLRKALQDEVLNRESIIEQRTIELADQNVKLHRLATEARQAARSKTVFLGTMSHELRTPLAAVVGFADLLTRECDRSRPKVSDLSASLLENAHKLRTTINKVLEISALDDGDIKVKLQPVDLASLLAEIRNGSLYAARRKGLQLDVDCTALSPPTVETSASRLREVMEQILDNAIKFTDCGKVSIVASSKPDGGWAISVQDTGPGIPKRDVDRVCERFYQVDQEDNRRFGGAGLGLSIATELCHLMNLTLDIDSRFGEGTTVQVTYCHDDAAGSA